MKIALAGLPKSGKTTIFNALTRQQAAVGSYSSGNETNIAIVKVEDERINRLTEIYSPQKTVNATIEIADCPALAETEEKNDIPEAMLKVMKNSNALGLVIRNFDCPLCGSPSPEGDLARITETLIFSDLLLADTRLERIAAMEKKGQKAGQPLERQALEMIHGHLESGKPIRSLSLDEKLVAAIKGLQFLTDKPVMIILNSSEQTFGKSASLSSELSDTCIEFAGAFEMELSGLNDPSEAEAFMADMGITKSARDRLTLKANELLGYISFFTVGSDEVRAWNLKRGGTAIDAAGAIHTDLARGFIRAECFHYNDLTDLGSEKAVREKGRFRLEGKTYAVKDGDIISIRFNV